MRKDGMTMKIIVLKDYYPNPVGDEDVIEIGDELFELLILFKRKWEGLGHQERRYHDKEGYVEGKTELKVSPIPSTVESEVISADEARRVREALSSLTDVQRRRVQAYFFEGLTHAQIACVEGTSPQAVRQSIQDALTKIRIIF